MFQFLCSHAHCWNFWQCTGVNMGTLNGLCLCSPIATNSNALCILTHEVLSESALTSTFGATVTQLVGLTIQANNHCYQMQWALATHDPLANLLFSPWTTLRDTDYCTQVTLKKSCSFGDALTQSSSHHTLVLVKLTHILPCDSPNLLLILNRQNGFSLAK